MGWPKAEDQTQENVQQSCSSNQIIGRVKLGSHITDLAPVGPPVLKNCDKPKEWKPQCLQ